MVIHYTSRIVLVEAIHQVLPHVHLWFGGPAKAPVDVSRMLVYVSLWLIYGEYMVIIWLLYGLYMVNIW
jgi:hypothetical protein